MRTGDLPNKSSKGDLRVSRLRGRNWRQTFLEKARMKRRDAADFTARLIV
jgi:hypothetical protein